MDIKRLKKKFGTNKPIFTEEILKEFSEYSRPKVFQLIKKAVEKEELLKFSRGVYFIPTMTILGKSTIIQEDVVEKKYVQNKNDIFGIYGRNYILRNFMVHFQVPVTIEVITNNETTRVRKLKLRGRWVIIRKSRCKITKNNFAAYTIMELFSNIVMKEYRDNPSVKREILKYVRENKISKNDLFALFSSFPAKTIKKLVESEIIYEIS